MPEKLSVGISELKYSTRGELLKTTLGSCISVILYSRLEEDQIASMCHFLLPEPLSRSDLKRHPDRYGDVLVRKQIRGMLERGIRPEHLQAKIAGGASLLIRETTSLPDIGRENVRKARALLSEAEIPLMSEHVGGTTGRAILFDPLERSLLIQPFGREPLYI